MSFLSKNLSRIKQSPTMEITARAQELKANGLNIISLSVGEPDFDTPQNIKEAGITAINQGKTKYTAVDGMPELKEAICNKFQKDNGLTYSKDQVIVSTGGKQVLFNALLATLNAGDEVVIPAPYWVSYLEIVKVAEGIPVIVHAGIENDFKITGAQLEAAITPKTKLMLFSTPCNPTGSVYSKDELKDLAIVLQKYPSLIALSDEIYEHINFEGKHESLAQFPEIYDQVVTVNGVSKAWAMTGWRLGYIAAHKDIAAACDKVQGQFTSATCSITQKAAIAAMNADPKILDEMIGAFKSRRKLVLDALAEIPGLVANKPGGAFYVFPNVSSFFGKSYNGRKISNSEELCMYLLEEGLVALVGGDAFGDPNCMRISYAASEKTLTEAMKRIKNALLNLH